MIWTKAFWKGLGERALKTFIQSAIGALIVAVGAATSAWDVPWADAVKAALGIALLSTFFSVATSFQSAEFVAGKPLPVESNSTDDGI